MIFGALFKVWQIGVLAAVLSLFFPINDAHAQSVTVGGIIYDITILGGNRSFNDDYGSIVTSPWFGNQTLAGQIAVQYFADFGAPNLTAGDSDTTLFAFSESIFLNEVRSRAIHEFFGPFSSDYVGDPDATSSSVSYAAGVISGTAVEVPEINGNALAKSLFVLMAFGMILYVQRRKALTAGS